MRYIIGLCPLHPLPYIKIAQELFSDMSDGYLLSETVHPHITLTQFETEDPKLLSTLWDNIQEYKIQPLMPDLIGFSFKKGKNEHKNFYWAQIAVERESNIVAMHFQMLDILKKYHLVSLIDSEDIYKPHLTLARINLRKPIPVWPEDILKSSLFKITLGASDQNGRYLEKIYD